MRKRYASLLAQCVAVGLFWASASASASVIITFNPSPEPMYFFPLWGYAPICLDGQTCPGGPWVDANLPDIGVPATVAFDSQNLFIGAHLANAQQGSFSVLLTPSGDLTNPNEIYASLATNRAIIAVSEHGRLEFTANPGTDYFLLLGGTVRPATAYSLSISPVPEPASGALIAVGLALVAYRARQSARRQA